MSDSRRRLRSVPLPLPFRAGLPDPAGMSGDSISQSPSLLERIQARQLPSQIRQETCKLT